MKFNALGNFRYLKSTQVIVLSLVGVFCLITYTESRPLFFLLGQFPFYKAWLLNSLMASLVVIFTIYANRLLDHHYPWARHFSNRLKQQFFWAFLLPLAFAVLLAFLYFLGYRINLFETIYFNKLLFVEVMLLLLLNYILYLLYQRHYNQQTKIKQKHLKEMKALATDFDFSEIAYFYSKNKLTFWVNHADQEMVWSHNITTAHSRVPARDFFLVRRGFLVSRVAISSVTKEKDSYKIYLQPPLHKIISASRYESAKFITWWHHPELY
jgi:uncharacterized membrane protein YesL